MQVTILNCRDAFIVFIGMVDCGYFDIKGVKELHVQSRLLNNWRSEFGQLAISCAWSLQGQLWSALALYGSLPCIAYTPCIFDTLPHTVPYICVLQSNLPPLKLPLKNQSEQH